MSTGFQSIDAPPERHANRVTAVIMRELAKRRALIGPAIAEALRKSKDGTPRAQTRMAQRILKAGALHVSLRTGTRGRYAMTIYEVTGWNPVTDQEIGVGDPLPDKPWVACFMTLIADRGRTRKSAPVLFVTHHAISRAAQRFKLRTSEHIINATDNIMQAVLWEFHVAYEAGRHEQFFTPPPQGRRLRLNEAITVVLQRHRTGGALVVATIVPADDELDGPAPMRDESAEDQVVHDEPPAIEAPTAN